MAENLLILGKKKVIQVQETPSPKQDEHKEINTKIYYNYKGKS